MKTKLLFLILFLSSACQAQNSLTINYCGNKTMFQFKEDTVVSFNENRLVQLKVIEPISLSKADVEIRLYGNDSGIENTTRVISFFKDSIIVNYFRSGSRNYGNAKEFNKWMVALKGYKIIPTGIGTFYYVKEISYNKIYDKTDQCRLLKKLLDSHIGVLPDGIVLDALVKAKYPKIDCYDCGGVTFLEIKVGTHYRNIKTMSYPYGDKENAEKEIKELFYKKQIYDILNHIENFKKL